MAYGQTTISIKDGAGASKTWKVLSSDAASTGQLTGTNLLLDAAGAEVIGQVTASPTANTVLDRLKTIGTNTAAATPAGEAHIGEVGGKSAVVSANFNRPADATAYASGDLVANNTTAGSVAALAYTSAARVSGGSGMVRRVRLKKSGASVTNASFRVHFYGADPAASTGITNGDNGAWLTKHASYLGAVDITVDKAFSDAAAGVGVPNSGGEINYVATNQTIWALIEARAAYTPASGETFTVELELLQN